MCDALHSDTFDTLFDEPNVSLLRFVGLRCAPLLLAFAAACSGGDKIIPPTAAGSDSSGGDVGSIGITVASAALSIARGSSGTVAISLMRGTPFLGIVNLTIEGLPTGVTAAFAPAEMSIGVTQSALTVQPGANAAAGAFTLTIRARAPGLADATQSVAVTVIATPAGTLALNATSASVTVASGDSHPLNIGVVRGGGFAGPVTLTPTCPPGVTCTFQAGNVVGASFSSGTLQIVVSGTVATGSYTITIRGSGSGVADATLNVTLVVTGGNGYTLAIAPNPITIIAGTSASVTINITRPSGFTADVGLIVTGVPTGVTATLAQSTVSGNSTTLTFVVPANVVASSSTVTVSGAAAGAGIQNATVLLVIQSAGGGGTGNIAYRFCDTSRTVAFFATQNGTGAWTPVAASGGVYRFDVASGRGGVAYVTRAKTGAADYDMQVLFATAAELTQAGTALCVTNVSRGRTMTGSITGIGANELGAIAFGGQATGVNGSGGFSIANVWDGAQDLIAQRYTVSAAGDFAPTRLLIRRGVSPTGTSLAAIDMNGGEAFAPQSRTLNIVNLGADQATASGSYITTTTPAVTGTLGNVLWLSNASTRTTRTFATVPTDRQQTGDLHAMAIVAVTSSGNIARISVLYQRASSDQTITLGSVPPLPTVVNIGGTDYARPRAAGTLASGAASIAQASYAQTVSDGSRSATMQATAAYLGGASYDMTIPDFSTTPTWSPTYGLVSTFTINWVVSGVGVQGVANPFAAPADGTTLTYGARSGTIDPPKR